MGGDYAPKNIVLGAIEAYRKLSEKVQFFLFGDQNEITEISRSNGFDPGNFFIVHCSENIAMDEHPVKAFFKKSNSSIAVGFNMLEKGEIDAFASAGNTGAMLAGCVTVIKRVEGVIRPCISVELPVLTGGSILLLDVGFNADCNSDILYQFALLGDIYAKTMMGISNPRVALLNIGEEEGKGNMVYKEAYPVLACSDQFNFVGNIESNHLFNGGIADVIVTDGFTGNICLKQAEAMYEIISSRGINDQFFERFNYEIYGGTPVLGVSSPVIIGHGASSSAAITNMIIQAEKSLSSGLIGNFNIFAV